MSRLSTALIAALISILISTSLQFFLVGEVKAVPNHQKGTVAMWVKPNWDGNDGVKHYIFVGNALSTTDDNSIQLYKDDLDFIHGFVYGNAGAGGDVPPGDISQTSTDQWKKNVWHHVALSWDTSAISLKLYIDGALRAAADSNDLDTDNFPTVAQGQDYQGVYRDGTSFPFDGEIKDVNKYDTPQTDGVIATLATQTPAEKDVIAAIDKDAPAISSVSSTTSYTSATITWTTNEDADSQVEYGETTSYGQSSNLKDTTTRVKSHSVTISGLKPETTYHFIVKSKDASANLATSSDYTLATIKAPVPTLTLDVPEDKVTQNATPTITGITRSSISSRAEISLDGGVTWTPVEKTSTSGTRRFKYTPSAPLVDGNYNVVARAVDEAGQEGKSDSYILVVDTLPPRIGPPLFTIGPQIILPSQDGLRVTQVGLTQKITTSSVGGTTELSIKPVSLLQGGADSDKFTLTKSSDTGLWSGSLSFSRPGVYKLDVHAVDGAQNEITKNLSSMVVLSSGVVTDGEKSIAGAEIFLYSFDQISKRFVPWQGAPFAQVNPQETNEEGGYHLIVPPGTYYLQIKAPGYHTQKSKIFKLEETSVINADFLLKSAISFKLGSLTITLPSFSLETHQVVLKQPLIPEEAKVEGNLIGREFSYFVFESEEGEVDTNDFRGKPAVFTFLTRWSPQIGEQISAMEDLAEEGKFSVVAIMSQETVSSTEIYKKRGGYQFPVLADSKGELTDTLSISGLPSHIFTDRKGVIKEVIVGVLTKEELMDNLVR